MVCCVLSAMLAAIASDLGWHVLLTESQLVPRCTVFHDEYKILNKMAFKHTSLLVIASGDNSGIVEIVLSKFLFTHTWKLL